MAAVLGLPAATGEVIAAALEATTAAKPPVIWLEFQDCTGDTESFLRASRRADIAVSGKTDPSLTELVLDVLSIDYHETLMAAAGVQAEQAKQNTLANYAGQYICVVEGSIPTALNGYCCTVGGKTALSIVQEVCSKAKMTIAFGSCAWDGGLAAANPNPTGAKGVKDVLPGLANLVNIPGCPANSVNLVATIVYFLTYGTLPALDSQRRPSFAFGTTVHDRCQRLGRQEAQSFGDAAYRNGGCLKGLGCRGPETMANCPTVKWNDGYCWPVLAGHGCIGCTSSHFWDTMLPIYNI
jgi:hydrogenase small subunit